MKAMEGFICLYKLILQDTVKFQFIGGPTSGSCLLIGSPLPAVRDQVMQSMTAPHTAALAGPPVEPCAKQC